MQLKTSLNLIKFQFVSAMQIKRFNDRHKLQCNTIVELYWSNATGPLKCLSDPEHMFEFFHYFFTISQFLVFVNTSVEGATQTCRLFVTLALQSTCGTIFQIQANSDPRSFLAYLWNSSAWRRVRRMC